MERLERLERLDRLDRLERLDGMDGLEGQEQEVHLEVGDMCFPFRMYFVLAVIPESVTHWCALLRSHSIR